MITLNELKEHCEKTINPIGKIVFDDKSKTYQEHKMVLDLIKEHENRAQHYSELLDKVVDRIHQKMCSKNCGERQCVDNMDRCVWYGYVTEVITELKAEVNE